MGAVWAQFWPAFIIALAGIVAVAVWRGSRSLLAALVEIARLPSLVEDLLEEIRDVLARVSALEALVPDDLRVRADLTLSHDHR